jgi:hypothetical protein
VTCKRCLTEFDADEPRCPRCGEANPDSSGVFQSSTVMISAGGARRIYRSMEEVPNRLRTRLVESTNGSNSATILIADRRGREEIAKALRKLPGSAQRRLRRSARAAHTPAGWAGWLTPGRKTAGLCVLALLFLLAIAIVFAHRW